MRSRSVILRVFLLALIALPSRGFADQAEQAGTFIAVDGEVEISRGDGWVPARVGLEVHVGDQVRTGDAGKARIAFRDRSTLNVGEASTVAIDEHVFDVEKGRFQSYMRLLRGKVRALVTEYYSDPTASYQIETATAVSGVRGTEFVVAFDEELTQVVGLTGTVEVRGLHMREQPGVMITGGKFTSVARGQAPTPARDLGPQQMRDFLRGLQLTTAIPGGEGGGGAGAAPAGVAPGGSAGTPAGAPAGAGDDPVLSGDEVPKTDRAPGGAPAGGGPVTDVPAGAPNAPSASDPIGGDGPKTPADVADQPVNELGEIGVNF